MRPIKIALVGCGGMASNYRHIYTDIPGAELALVVDADEKTAIEAAQTLQVPKWSEDFNDCLSADIDIVDISTPNFLHCEQAVAALKAGKHVLMQKPMASTVEEAEAIVSMAEATGKTAGMYMSLFDNPLYYDVKRLIDEGKLGAIVGVHCRCAHTGGLTMAKGNWRESAAKTGGGSFIQLAIHNLNMAQWLTGSRIASVMAYSQNLHCPNIGGDDGTAATFAFDSGALGTVSSSYCSEKDELSIYGTRGYISIDDNRYVTLKLSERFQGDILSFDTPGERKTVHIPYDSFSLFDAKNPRDQHAAFVKAVQNGEPPPISVQVGLHDMRIVQAVYESAKRNRRVSVGRII